MKMKISDQQVERFLKKLRSGVKNCKLSAEEFELLLVPGGSMFWDVWRLVIKDIESHVKRRAEFYLPFQTTLSTNYKPKLDTILSKTLTGEIPLALEHIPDKGSGRVIYRAMEFWSGIGPKFGYRDLDLVEFDWSRRMNPQIYKFSPKRESLKEPVYWEFADVRTICAYIRKYGHRITSDKISGISTIFRVDEVVYLFSYEMIPDPMNMRMVGPHCSIQRIKDWEKYKVRADDRFLLVAK